MSLEAGFEKVSSVMLLVDLCDLTSFSSFQVGSVTGIMDSMLTLVSLTDTTLKDHGLAEEGEMDEVSDQEGIVEKVISQ